MSGEGEIRTRDDLAIILVFKTSSIDHSDTSPEAEGMGVEPINEFPRYSLANCCPGRGAHLPCCQLYPI